MANIRKTYRFYISDSGGGSQDSFEVRLHDRVKKTTKARNWTGIMQDDAVYEQMRAASAGADKDDIDSWPKIRFTGPKEGPWTVTIPPNDPIPNAFDPRRGGLR